MHARRPRHRHQRPVARVLPHGLDDLREVVETHDHADHRAAVARRSSELVVQADRELLGRARARERVDRAQRERIAEARRFVLGRAYPEHAANPLLHLEHAIGLADVVVRAEAYALAA